jgi:hypothetical protein
LYLNRQEGLTVGDTIFDALHRAFFDQLFGLDEDGRRAKADLLRRAGVPEDQIADLTKPGILPGMTFGGAKAGDVAAVVERVLFRQRAGSVLLRVSRPPYDESGHVEVAVLEVGPPAEERVRKAPTSGPDGRGEG